MIDQTFPFSVDAAAPPVNVIPAAFQPLPFAGFLSVWGVTDANDDLTALPTLQVLSGGAPAPINPVPTSVIPFQEFGVVFAGPTRENVLLSPTAVQQGQQMQILLGGGAGSTATGRLRIRLMSPDELQANLAG